jgi:hypothetical protein
MGRITLNSIPSRGKNFCSSPKPTNDLRGPMQPSIQWVMGFLSLGIKRLEREAAYSPASHTNITNEWSYTPTHPICLWGMSMDNFTSTLKET